MPDVGSKRGRITLLSITKVPKSKPLGLFRCDCGTEVEKTIDSVFWGSTSSCGCLKREMLISRNTTHGKAHTREYKIWASMIQRCTNPKRNNYELYGERFITVCDEWRSSFEKFLEDMGIAPDGLTLERKDNARGYSRDNCVWADDYTQANNKRNNVVIEFNGKRLSLKQWAREVDIDYHALYWRYQAGWSAEKILTTPSSKLTQS